MTKNEALEKAQVTVDNDKRRIILEKRLARLENLIKNESADDPNVILLEAVADGVVSWEVLCRELMANVADDALWTTCSNLGLIEDDDMMEASKESDKPVKNEDAGNDIYDAAYQWMKGYAEELDEGDYWVQRAGSVRDMLQIVADKAADPVVDNCCMELGVDETSDDRDVVEDALSAAAEEAMQYMGDDEDMDDEDWDEDWDEDTEDEEFESHKRVSRKPAKNEAAKKPMKKESVKRPAKRSLVSRFHK